MRQLKEKEGGGVIDGQESDGVQEGEAGGASLISGCWQN